MAEVTRGIEVGLGDDNVWQFLRILSDSLNIHDTCYVDSAVTDVDPDPRLRRNGHEILMTP